MLFLFPITRRKRLIETIAGLPTQNWRDSRYRKEAKRFLRMGFPAAIVDEQIRQLQCAVQVHMRQVASHGDVA